MSRVVSISPGPGWRDTPWWQCCFMGRQFITFMTPTQNNRVWSRDLARFNCRLQLSIFRELLQLGEFLQRVEMRWMGCITATMDIWFKILQSKCWWYIIKVKSLNTKNSFKYDFHQLDSKTPTLALLAACNCFCSEGQSPQPVSERHKKHVRWLLTIFIGAHTSILLSEQSIWLPVIVTWLCFNRFELFRKQMDHAMW